MKMNIKKTLLSVAVIALALASEAQANDINGTFNIGNSNYTVTDGSVNSGVANLTVTSTTIALNTQTNDFIPEIGTLSYNGVISESAITTSHDYSSLAFTLSDGSTFVWTPADAANDYYTTGGAGLNQTFAAGVEGLFTPGTNLPGASATEAYLNVTFSQSGAAYSVTGTFTSPASLVVPPVPEPVTLSMLGLGLVGWAANRRRKAA